MNVLDKFSLAGKVALVTGAGKNLGRELALALAEAGADVAVTSRTEKEVQDTAREIRVKGRKACAAAVDVCLPGQVADLVRNVVSELGRIDILVNNAATRCTKPILDMSEEEWRTVIDSNMTSAFLCCRAVGPIMIRQGGGRIINIASRIGLRGMANRVPYCSAKGGLIQLTRALALEWAQYGILVNAVAPGLMNTEPAFDAIRQGKTTKIPLKRAGEPEEISPLVIYLASGACTYMTGEVIVIDGGWAVQ
jgi:NAD(P)-dependent dehydrogenase (short-subunit alcohol dehydrogenase family)